MNSLFDLAVPAQKVPLLFPDLDALPGFSATPAPAATVVDEQELAAAYEAGHAQGRREAETERGEQARRDVEQECAAMRDACVAFQQERARYFHELEREVAALSLAIARKVLGREAACDPLLLEGAVHVALREVSGGDAVELRVPAADHARWKRALSSRELLSVVADDAMVAGDCTLVSQASMADLSVASQLDRIESLLGRQSA